jgi:hypothetical protein
MVYSKVELEAKADDELTDYDFETEIMDMEHGSSWDDEKDGDEVDLNKVLYVNWEDDPEPNTDSTKVSFHVRFSKEGKVTDVYALDVETGNEIGKRGNNMKESKARKFIEELEFSEGPKQPEGSSDIIDDKLNKEVTILQGILAKKGLGDKATFQTANGAMINILALGAKNDEVGVKPPEKEITPEPAATSSAAKVIGAASSICATESYKVSKDELVIAQKMKDKGYKYFVKVPEDDRLLYFRYVQDVGPFMRDSYPNSKIEASGYIKNLSE